MKDEIVYEIRKGIKEIDGTEGIIIKVQNTKDYIIIEDHVIVEDDYMLLSIEHLYNIRYSSKWYAFRVLFNYLFRFKKTNIKYVLKIDIEKYCSDIFIGLEELGVVTKNQFYYKDSEIYAFHPGEPVWLGEERVELNKEKFIKYLKRNYI